MADYSMMPLSWRFLTVILAGAIFLLAGGVYASAGSMLRGCEETRSQIIGEATSTGVHAGSLQSLDATCSKAMALRDYAIWTFSGSLLLALTSLAPRALQLLTKASTKVR
jgi:hypothetical protein